GRLRPALRRAGVALMDRREHAARVALDRPPGESPRLPKTFHVLDRPHGEGGEHYVVGDEVRPDVGAASAPVAPRGGGPENRGLAAAEALPSLHRRVALLGWHVGEAGRVLQTAQLLLDPRRALTPPDLGPA